MSDKIVISTIRTQDEFDQFDQILQEFYGKTHNAVKTKEWWVAYPNVSIIMKINDKVVGGITLHPIDKQQFDKFIAGHIKENDLSIDNINRNNWYIDHYIIAKDYRNMSNFMKLAISGFDIWKSNQSGHFPVKIAALPSTKNGEKGARGLTLKPYLENGPDNLPIYFKQINTKFGLHFYVINLKLRVLLVRLKYWAKSLKSRNSKPSMKHQVT
jgi:hypothetical protein